MAKIPIDTLNTIGPRELLNRDEDVCKNLPLYSFNNTSSLQLTSTFNFVLSR